MYCAAGSDMPTLSISLRASTSFQTIMHASSVFRIPVRNSQTPSMLVASCSIADDAQLIPLTTPKATEGLECVEETEPRDSLRVTMYKQNGKKRGSSRH
jgi:hypothetical protein